MQLGGRAASHAPPAAYATSGVVAAPYSPNRSAIVPAPIGPLTPGRNDVA